MLDTLTIDTLKNPAEMDRLGLPHSVYVCECRVCRLAVLREELADRTEGRREFNAARQSALRNQIHELEKIYA